MSFSYLGVFGAGVLTFLSPCVLPLAPVLTASFVMSDRDNRWARFWSTLWFSLGFVTVFVLMGLGLPQLSAALGAARPWVIALGGILFALFGLKMMDIIKPGKYFTWMTRTVQLPDFSSRIPKGLHGLLFGALFGLSWTPCVGPILGGVLTYVASQDRSPTQGALLLLAFSLGIALPLLGLALASEYVLPVLNRIKRHLPKIEYAAGVGLFVFGIYVFNQGRMQIPAQFASASQDSVIRATVASGDRIDLGNASPQVSRMVFFYSENCPICHAMEKFLPDFEKGCTNDHFQLVRVNVDMPENAQAANRFNIRAVPTVSLLNDRGTEISHLVGYQTESSLREAAKLLTHIACATDLKIPPIDEIPGLETGKTCSAGKSC